jgi:predicted GH43/DUF377 family glycosyl hydrolase
MIKKLIIEAKNINPSRKDFEVIGIFNPTVIKYGNEILMLARVAERVIQSDKDNYLLPLYVDKKGIEIMKIAKDNPNYDYSDVRLIKNHQCNYLTSISHLEVLRSADGVNFKMDNAGIFPSNIYEEYGIEDARITKIDNIFYITYSAISSCGINVELIKTLDFKSFERLGNILHSDNKDCVIFPEMINGKYLALHRPSISQFGKLDIWTAESNNLIDWGNHKIMLNARVNYNKSVRVGAGAVPFLTDKGWLEIYHSADENNRYNLTAMLLDKNNPNKILMKSKAPLIEPTEIYEKEGFFGNVVFTCGLINSGDKVTVYYGVCDENIAMAELTIKEIFDNMEVI